MQHGSDANGRVALVVFGAYVAAALPLLLFRLGRYHWFFGDEWSFLAERDGADVDDLFRSHGEHWTTIPILVYRLLFNVFGLRSYLPYQAVLVLLHLTAAVLLRVVMRRAGVSPWTATITASVFVLFGPGEENIVWAFQMSFVGAAVFGLLHVILSDHDGPSDWRDGLGLLAGVASLMCSGVGLVMGLVAGVFALLRRGWRAAVLHSVPLVVIYGVWFALSDPGGIDNPYGRNVVRADELALFVASGVRGVFEAIGGSSVIGAFAGGAFVVGAFVAWKSNRGVAVSRFALPLALAIGAVAFLVGTALARWFVTPRADNQSRYLYTLAFFLLPGFAVAVDALIRRWRITAPIAFSALLFAIVVNVDDFGSRPPFNDRFHEQQRRLVVALATSEESQRVPAYARPNPWFTIGWLRQMAERDELPSAEPLSPLSSRQLPLLLGVTVIDGEVAGPRCKRVPDGITLAPSKGDRFEFRFASEPSDDANFFETNALVVTRIAVDGGSVGAITLKDDTRDTIEIESDGLTLHLEAANRAQELVVCSSAGRYLESSGEMPGT